jgi:hypothetical protein
MLSVVEFRQQVEKLIGDCLSLRLEGVEEPERGFGNSGDLPVVLLLPARHARAGCVQSTRQTLLRKLELRAQEAYLLPRSRKGPVTIARAMVSCSLSAFSMDTPRPCLVSCTSKPF